MTSNTVFRLSLRALIEKIKEFNRDPDLYGGGIGYDLQLDDSGNPMLQIQYMNTKVLRYYNDLVGYEYNGPTVLMSSYGGNSNSAQNAAEKLTTAIQWVMAGAGKVEALYEELIRQHGEDVVTELGALITEKAEEFENSTQWYSSSRFC